MAWGLTVNGVDKSAYVRMVGSAVSVSRPVNERATMRLDFLPGYYPDRFSDIVLYAEDGTTKLFGGVILTRKTKGVADREVKRVTACVCSDYTVYGDWRFVTKTYDTPVSVKVVLTMLVADYLSDYDVTLAPSQLDGVMLDGITWVNKKLTACLREITDRTGWLFRIDADKQLKMYAPGAEASTINISDAEPNCQDLTVDDSQELPVTLVTCVCGPTSPEVAVQQFWTQAGGATSWTADIPGLEARQPWALGVHVGGIGGPLLYYDVGPGRDYEWTAGNPTVLTLNTGPLPADGDVIDVIYGAQFPFSVSQDTGLTGPRIERIFLAPDAATYAAALEVLAQKVAEVGQEARVFNIISREHGWLPGTTVSIEKSERGVSTTSATITQVDLTLSSKLEWLYTIAAQETTAIQKSSLPLGGWREFVGGGGDSGSGSSVGSSTTTFLTASSPSPLGGSRSVSVVMSSSTWKPIAEHEVLLSQPNTRTWRIRCETWTLTSGITFRLRLRNIDDDTTTIESDPITPGNDPATPDVTYLTVEIPAGKEHQLEVLADDTPDDGEEMHAKASMATL